MVRRADHNGVNFILEFLEHLAKILELLRLGKLPECRPCPLLIHIAQCDKIFILDAAYVRGARPPTPIAAILSFSFGDWLNTDLAFPAVTQNPTPAMQVLRRNSRRQG